MSDFGAVARPYAEAIFSLAKDNNDFAKWTEVLSFVTTLSKNDELNEVLQNPSVDKESKITLVNAMVEKAYSAESKNKVDSEVLKFIATVMENERFAAVGEIANRYEILRKEVDNELDVLVETALEIEASALKTLSASLEKKFGKKVSITTSLKPELIGGMVIHAGDTVIDDSVSGKLKKLSSAIKK